MKDLVKVFDNPEFGEVRTLDADGKIYFVASDVAKALGYSNTRDAISRHCKGVVKRDTPTSGGKQTMNVIPEGDVYRLVVHSKLPSAEKFESWVFDDVLPSIRKSGGYQMPINVKLEKKPRYQTRLIATAVRDMGATAKELVKTFGCKKSMALTITVPMMGKIYGFDSSPLLQLIPPEKNPASLTATDIAERLHIRFKNGKPNAAKANQLLESNGLQEKHGKEWRLTEEGKAYGESKPYNRNGHSGYQILWTPEVVDLLKPADAGTSNLFFLEEARKRGWQQEDA